MTSSGLARFVAPAPVAAPADPPAGASGPAARAEACDMCGTALADGHDHLVDAGSRALLCACRPCWLLFENPAAGAGRYRRVPSRYLHDPGFSLAPAEWDELQVPVGLAFFFVNSGMDRWVAFYPSPAGATESVLPTESWRAVLERNPGLTAVEPDVEALLVRRHGGRFECFLVPIDACYRLVGLMRLHWRGFDGGAEMHECMEGFFDEMAARAGPPPGER